VQPDNQQRTRNSAASNMNDPQRTTTLPLLTPASFRTKTEAAIAIAINIINAKMINNIQHHLSKRMRGSTGNPQYNKLRASMPDQRARIFAFKVCHWATPAAV
jgi:hypothetical protein